MNKRKDQFFEELAKDMKNSEYAERLKEELEDHIDDVIEDTKKTGERDSETLQTALDRIGSPKNIAKEYNLFIRSQNHFTPWFEVLFVSILSLPLYTLAVKIGLDFLYRISESKQMIGESFALHNFAPGFLVRCLLLLFGFVLFYTVTLSGMNRAIARGYASWHSLIALFILPALLFFAAITNLVSFDYRDWLGPVASEPVLSAFLFFALFTLSVGTALGVCVVSLHIYRRNIFFINKRRGRLTHLWQRAQVIFPTTLTAAFVIYIVISTALLWTNYPIRPDHPLLSQTCYAYDPVCLTLDQGIPEPRLVFEFFSFTYFRFCFSIPSHRSLAHGCWGLLSPLLESTACVA